MLCYLVILVYLIDATGDAYYRTSTFFGKKRVSNQDSDASLPIQPSQIVPFCTGIPESTQIEHNCQLVREYKAPLQRDRTIPVSFGNISPMQSPESPLYNSNKSKRKNVGLRPCSSLRINLGSTNRDTLNTSAQPLKQRGLAKKAKRKHKEEKYETDHGQEQPTDQCTPSKPYVIAESPQPNKLQRVPAFRNLLALKSPRKNADEWPGHELFPQNIVSESDYDRESDSDVDSDSFSKLVNPSTRPMKELPTNTQNAISLVAAKASPGYHQKTIRVKEEKVGKSSNRGDSGSSPSSKSFPAVSSSPSNMSLINKIFKFLIQNDGKEDLDDATISTKSYPTIIQNVPRPAPALTKPGKVSSKFSIPKKQLIGPGKKRFSCNGHIDDAKKAQKINFSKQNARRVRGHLRSRRLQSFRRDNLSGNNKSAPKLY